MANKAERDQIVVLNTAGVTKVCTKTKISATIKRWSKIFEKIVYKQLERCLDQLDLLESS